jgi:hypothetical protein
VKNNIICHDVVEGFFVPKIKRAINNGKPSLKDTECSFQGSKKQT